MKPGKVWQSKAMPSFSVLVRTRNEEKYLGRCLQAIRNQINTENLEVILIDNVSTDLTLSIAKRYCDKILTIEDFTPGRALNLGVAHASFEFIAIISGHCIPQSSFWLQELSRPFFDNKLSSKSVVGVYGRQVPEASSSPLDKRDLWNVFREEDRLQCQDVFFHNANSLIPRSVLLRHPFDESATNVEDRIWGKEMILNGHSLYYASKATVYHWHGINHAGDIARAEKVVTILEERGIYDTPTSGFID